jgi:hypothetical protein
MNTFLKIDSLEVQVLKFSFDPVKEFIQPYFGTKQVVKFIQNDAIHIEFLGKVWESQILEEDEIWKLTMITCIDETTWRIQMNWRVSNAELKFLSGDVRYREDGDWWIEAMLKLNKVLFSEKPNEKRILEKPTQYAQLFPRVEKTLEKTPVWQQDLRQMNKVEVCKWIMEQGVSQEQAEIFIKEDIDGSVLFDLDDQWLNKFGFTGGNRIKILKAINKF